MSIDSTNEEKLSFQGQPYMPVKEGSFDRMDSFTTELKSFADYVHSVADEMIVFINQRGGSKAEDFNFSVMNEKIDKMVDGLAAYKNNENSIIFDKLRSILDFLRDLNIQSGFKISDIKDAADGISDISDDLLKINKEDKQNYISKLVES